MRPMTFTVAIGTADGHIRETTVHSPTGEMAPILPACHENVQEGEMLLSITDEHGDGISYVTEGDELS
jgi:hypothetical protein